MGGPCLSASTMRQKTGGVLVGGSVLGAEELSAFSSAVKVSFHRVCASLLHVCSRGDLNPRHKGVDLAGVKLSGDPF